MPKSRPMLRPALVLAAFLALAGAPAMAQATDPADLAFWQSIQASTDPAEYQAYIEAFPNGRFVQLARARLTRLQAGGGGSTGGTGGAGTGGGAPITIPGMTAPGTANPGPVNPGPANPGPGTPTTTAGTRPGTPTPAPTPSDPPEDTVAEKITVEPASPRVGQIITFACLEFPDPTSFDVIAVVPAGTPEMDPSRNPDDTKILARDYAVNCKRNGSWKAGPFAPGRYEVRFITQLYNNARRYDVRTRTPFAVR